MRFNTRNKLLLSALFIFILPVLLSSCSRDESELSEIAAVMGIGVDKVYGEKPILVTLEIISTKGIKGISDKSQKGSCSFIQTSTGRNLFDAVENFSKNSTALIDFSHTKVIILSRNYCESGMPEVLDYIARDHQLRETIWLLISDKTAGEVLKNKMQSDDITSTGIDKMMNRYKKDASILPTRINDFVVNSQCESKTSFAPIIDLEKREDNTEGKIKMERIAVFKNNNLIGTLNNEESKSLLWISGNTKGHMDVLPFEAGEQSEQATLEVYKKSVKIIPKMSGAEVHFQIECTGDAILKEIQNVDLTPDMIKKMEANTESILKRQINELIHKSQKDFNADLIGFSNKIFNNNPKLWVQMEKNWYEIYPNLSYNINFKIKLDKVGLIKSVSSEKE